MHKGRVDALAEVLRANVWVLLDGEPELSADDVGKVAAAVEKTFRAALLEECDGCGREAPTLGGFCADCYRNHINATGREPGEPIADDEAGEADDRCGECGDMMMVFSDGRAHCPRCDHWRD